MSELHGLFRPCFGGSVTRCCWSNEVRRAAEAVTLLHKLLQADCVPLPAAYEWKVAHLGPGFLLLDTPGDHPPGPASILLCVDQSERRWDVRLPTGISATAKRAALRL